MMSFSNPPRPPILFENERLRVAVGKVIGGEELEELHRREQADWNSYSMLRSLDIWEQ